MKSFVPSLIEDSIDWDYSMHISELNKWNGSKTGPTNVKSDLTVWWSQPGLWTGHHPHPSSPVISEARSGSWSTAPNFVWSGKHFASTSPSQHTFFWKWHKQSTPKCLGAYVEQSQQSLKYGARYSACCQLSAWSVQSFSAAAPHFMTSKENGQFLCDAQCVSTKICSHTVAATEHSGHLSDFLQLYITTNQCTNITTAGMLNMPKGQGQKVVFPSVSALEVHPQRQIWSFLTLHFKFRHPACVLSAAMISPPTLTLHTT